jgi:hypothetical protein
MSSPSSRRSPRRSSIADEEVDELESSEDELLLVPETKARSSTHLHSPVPRKRSKSTSRAKRAKHTHESSPPLFSDAIEAASDVEAEAEAEAEIDGDAETGDDPDGRRWQCEWMDCKDEFGRQGKLVKHLVHGKYEFAMWSFEWRGGTSEYLKQVPGIMALDSPIRVYAHVFYTIYLPNCQVIYTTRKPKKPSLRVCGGRARDGASGRRRGIR